MSNFTAESEKYFNTASFLFEVDGVTIGQFQEVSGLEVSIETEDIQEGGQNGFTHHLPGRMSWPNITLKRGVTNSDALFTWINKMSGDGFAGEGNCITRNTAAIVLTKRDGVRLRSWNFEGAFPVKWTGPNFSAGSSADAVVEELEITHHGFTVEQL